MFVIDAFLSLIFPPFCLHCGEEVQQSYHLFCFSCEKLLESSHVERVDAPSHQNSALFQIHALYDYDGPAGSLIKKLKYGHQMYLAKTIAAMIALNFYHENWDIPDVIVPVPTTFFKRLSRGFNQTERMAYYLGKIWECPVKNSLRRTLKSKSQAGLKKSQRESLSNQEFRLISDPSLQNKSVLLLDDVIATGATMHRCAEALLDSNPLNVNGLAFCVAL